MSDIGRNDPCPCGSGRKYKRCHLASENVARAAWRETESIHDFDHVLSGRIHQFAVSSLGPDYLGFDFDEMDDTDLQFLIPLMLYHTDFGGRSVAVSFMESEADSLTAREQSWLKAQKDAWFSVWEVESVSPGRLRLRDLLTGERREVAERRASEQVVIRHQLLARVVDFEGRSYLVGMHPIPLRPGQGSEVVEEIRRRLRVKRRVSPARLRGFRATNVVVDVWDDMLDFISERAGARTLMNTDGDSLLLVTDRYVFAPAVGSAVASAIRGLAGAEEESDGSFIIVRDETIIARVTLLKQSLKIETNSLRRADGAREKIEAACGDLARFKGRDLVDPMSSSAREAARRSAPADPSPPEMMAAARAWKQRHYASWLDEPIPALAGQTPREAIATEEGRQRVDALVRDIEHLEARYSPEERFDAGLLRRELGL